MHLIRWGIDMTPLAAETVDVRTGNAGEWFGPVFIFVLAALLDWSAVGNSAMRDRVAALGYYSAFVSILVIMGWTSGIKAAPGGDWSWELTGSAFAFFMHVALVLVAFGHLFKGTRKLTTFIHQKIKFDSGDSGENKINTTLLTFAAIAAISTPLARGAGGTFVTFVGTAVASLWSWLGNAAISLLGG